jgi:hypothetical protein
MRKLLTNRWLLVFAMAIITISCKKDEVTPAAVVASFEFKADATDWKKVTFTNLSQNATSVSWNFGDGSAASTDLSPVHTFESAGTYTVTLTATGSDATTSSKSSEVKIADPFEAIRDLTGDVSKTWKLLSETSPGHYAMEVGPQNRSSIYWALGRDVVVSERPCTMNDEFTFNVDGSFTYDAKGDVFADGGEFGPWSDDLSGSNKCVDATADNFKGKEDVDISAWNSSTTHKFNYSPANKKLTVKGKGHSLLCKKYRLMLK